jgi:excisionase family DNA binding protein
MSEQSLFGPALELLAEQIARRVSAQLAEFEQARSEERSPWMAIETAAAWLDWPKQRLYKLTAQGAIPHYKHEGRLLFHRGELERWLQGFAEGER